MQRLKIAIDPRLKEKHGPEICWTWRLLLAGIGNAWEETTLDGAPCDIAYVADLKSASAARFAVRADPRLWAERARLRLAAVRRCGDWEHPVYDGESPPGDLFRAVGGRLLCDRDLIFDVFWLATGQEERAWRQNKHGHYDLRAADSGWPELFRVAPASRLGARLEKTFAELGFPAALPRWPHGKKAAAGATHDVDYPEAVRWLEPLRILGRRGPRGLPAALSILIGKKHHWHFSSWVGMERRFGIRSAFYFAARQGSLLQYAAGVPDPLYDARSERFRELFRYLAAEGVEIGLHASYRAGESAERLAAEKRALEEASGVAVAGNRHHYWHLKPDDPEATLLLHERVGLRYDTSLAHNDYTGWRRGLSWPFFPFAEKERRELETLQIATAWMDAQTLGWRGEDAGDSLEILHALAARAREQGGCLVIDVHDYVFDDALFPGWQQTYRRFLEFLAVSSDFWIETPGRIAEHWIGRHAAITAASRGLTEGTKARESFP